MTRIGACFGLLLACAAAAAESQYFVVLGSYTTMGHAEEAKAQAAEKLPEPYSLVAADTPRGTYYRVMAGPYLGKQRATGMLEKARATGFADAWLLAEPSLVSPTYSGLDTPLLETEEVEDRLLSAGGDYEAPPRADPVAPRADAPSEADDDGPVLIEEAPPGYELHRLRRSGDS